MVAHTYDPVGAPTPLVLTEGAPTSGSDEVVLGRDDRPVTWASTWATGSRWPATREPRLLRVSGLGFAVETTTSDYDTGAWITPAAYDAIFTGFKEHGGPDLRRTGPGSPPGETAELITERVRRPVAGVPAVRAAAAGRDPQRRGAAGGARACS